MIVVEIHGSIHQGVSGGPPPGCEASGGSWRCDMGYISSNLSCVLGNKQIYASICVFGKFGAPKKGWVEQSCWG